MMKILFALALIAVLLFILFYQRLKNSISSVSMSALIALLLAINGLLIYLNFLYPVPKIIAIREIAQTETASSHSTETTPPEVPSTIDFKNKETVSHADKTMTLQDLYKRITPSIVYLRCTKTAGISVGTGFFIEPRGTVVTNHHVIRDSSRVEIITSNGNTYTGSGIVAEDPQNDLIIVASDVSPLDAVPLTINATLPEVGDKVAVIGHPIKLAMTISDGIVSAIRNAPVGIQITAPVSHGSSGSPVVNMKGEVIAVVWGGDRSGQNIGFTIPAEKLLKLTQRNSYPLAGVQRAEGPVNKDNAPARVGGIDGTLQRDKEALNEQRNKLLEEAKWHYERAKYLNRENDRERAFHHLDRALDICKRIGHHRCMISSLDAMGSILRRWGNHTLANEYQQQAAKLRAGNSASR